MINYGSLYYQEATTRVFIRVTLSVRVPYVNDATNLDLQIQS
jgi:hypothetical protein